MSHSQAVGGRRVLCLIPRGIEGKGGIERLFRYIAAEPQRLQPFELSFITTRGDGSIWLTPAYAIMASLLCVWHFVTGDANILHINLAPRGSAYRKLPFFLLAKTFRRPIVIQYHGSGFDAVITSQKRWVRISRWMLRNSDVVIALGERWRQLFEDFAGVDPGRIHVVYNAVPDFAARRTASHARSPFKICFAGQVGPRKGTDLLVDALTQLGDIDWHCTIAGDGDIREYRERLAKSGMLDRVAFTGWVPSEAIHKHMMDADVVVLPSRAEALPVSLIEGAAAGAALIGTDVGAISEIVEPQKTGVLIGQDGAELAAAIRLLSQDRPLLRRLQAGARQLFESRFTMEAMCEGLRAAYEHASGPRFS